jgi:enoyl-CoA hydratase
MSDEKISLGPILLREGHLARIQLRRPDQANRIEPADLITLGEILHSLSQDKNTRAVVLESHGRHFSAGYDIRRIMEIPQSSDAPTLENPFEAVVEALERLPQPTIARLHGGVFGGSTDLALACDFRIGTTQTEMFMPAAKLGLLYYPSGIRRFTERLGSAIAKRLFLLGEQIDAAEMLRIGFLSELVAPEALDARIAELVAQLAGQAPLAIRGAKHAIDALARGEFDLQEFKLREAQSLRSADLKEGVAAWKEKRAPHFNGK